MDLELERIASRVVDAAVKLHMRTRPGLLESVYETVLAEDLRERGLRVERQKWIAAELSGIKFQKTFRADLLVDQQLVVEVKAVEILMPVHWRQVLTYLRLMDLRLGLLINFGEVRLRDGLKRVVNGYSGFAS